ncbi:MAG: extracellular solute-binding protein [Chloroflexota bacterium]
MSRDAVTRRLVLKRSVATTVGLAQATLLAACGGTQTAVTTRTIVSSPSSSASITTAAPAVVAASATTALATSATATVATTATSSVAPKAIAPAGATHLQMLIEANPAGITLFQTKLLPEFSASHPGVTIDFGPGIDLTKLRTLFAGGTGPDLYTNGSAFVPAVAGGLAVDLGSRINQWGQLDDFFPASLVSSQWNGKQWGLPVMVAARTYMWRKDVLAQVGITAIPTTWDEVVDAARRTTTVTGQQIVRVGFNPPDPWLSFIQALLSTGKTLVRDGKVEFGGDEGMAVLQYMLDLNTAIRPAGATPPGGAEAAQYASGIVVNRWGNTAAIHDVSQYPSNDLAGIVVADPTVPSANGKYRMPVGDTITPTCLNFSDWVALGTQSKALDVAWAVLQYLVSPQPLLAYDETLYYQPPRKSVANQGFMQEPHLQQMVQVFAKYGQAQIRVPDQAFFIKTFTDMGTSVLSGKTDAKTALAEAARLIQGNVTQQGYTGTTL